MRVCGGGRAIGVVEGIGAFSIAAGGDIRGRGRFPLRSVQAGFEVTSVIARGRGGLSVDIRCHLAHRAASADSCTIGI